MMKILNKNIGRSRLLALVIMACALSCKKDLGNYKYAPANAITIRTALDQADPTMVVSDDSIVVAQNDSLIVPLILEQTMPSKALSFQWMVVQAASSMDNPTQYIVGTEQDLHARITLAPNLYKLVVKVTDEQTKVSFYKIYALNVATAPWGGEGWLVLQRQQTGSDVAVITTVDGSNHGSVYKDVYYAANGRKLPTGTFKVNVISYSTNLRMQKVTFFYPEGGLQVRSNDFSDSSVQSSWFLTPPAHFNFQVNGQVAGGQYEYIIIDGQLFMQKVNAITIKVPPLRFGAPILGTWTLSPFVLNNIGSEQYFTLYDKVNRCFLLYNMETNVLTPTNRPDIANSHFPPYSGPASALDPVKGSGFDLNNIGQNLVYAENAEELATGARPNYDCFFRNNAGDSTYLYQFPVYLTYSNNFSVGRFLLTEANNPGINKASIFACPTFLTMPGKFYYVNNNIIYSCDVAPLSNAVSTAGYSFPEGTIIKAMKVFKSGYKVLPDNEGKVLVVATNESASGGGNNVYFFRISAMGEIGQTPIDKYTGFDDITDISFKKDVGL